MIQEDIRDTMQTLRDKEFPHLSQISYLDYTASSPFPRSLPEAHLNNLLSRFQSNPHSKTAPSALSTDLMEATRQKVLSFFNASEDYTVVFTSNATNAAKLVGEAFPFRRGSKLVLSQDNHNSVLGIRCFARKHKVTESYLPLTEDFRLIDTKLRKVKEPSLLAYPAQSNFTGVKHGFELLHRAQEAGYQVLLDAAAFVSTTKLDMLQAPADFVTISFYKMFGYPTGIGALIAKKRSLSALKRPSFSGGTIEWVSNHPGAHQLLLNEESFHDGTSNFLDIPAVINGLSWIERIGYQKIQVWTAMLTQLMLEGLIKIKDESGKMMIKVYGPENMIRRGGTVAFNVVYCGRRVKDTLVTKFLAESSVYLRDGCFCNPGCAETALNITNIGHCAKYAAKEDVGKCLSVGVGFVRSSVGIGALEKEVETFISVLKEFCRSLERGEIGSPFWEVEDEVKDNRGRARSAFRTFRIPDPIVCISAANQSTESY